MEPTEVRVLEKSDNTEYNFSFIFYGNENCTILAKSFLIPIDLVPYKDQKAALDQVRFEYHKGQYMINITYRNR